MEYMRRAEQLLQSTFGHKSFAPGQKEVLMHLFRGKNAAAFFPTGSGKSLCFQMPAMIFPGLVVIVSPLISIMKDQVDFLKSKGIAAERVDSQQSVREYQAILTAIQKGTLDILYAAPERFTQQRFLDSLARAPRKISLLAVDEAHCTDWALIWSDCPQTT